MPLFSQVLLSASLSLPILRRYGVRAALSLGLRRR